MKRSGFIVVAIFVFYLGLSFSYGFSAEIISDEARGYFMKGKKLVESALSPSDFIEAEREFEKATELSPDWAEAYYNLALIASEIGKPVKAVKSFEKYLEITKNPADKN